MDGFFFLIIFVSFYNHKRQCNSRKFNIVQTTCVRYRRLTHYYYYYYFNAVLRVARGRRHVNRSRSERTSDSKNSPKTFHPSASTSSVVSAFYLVKCRMTCMFLRVNLFFIITFTLCTIHTHTHTHNGSYGACSYHNDSCSI